MRGGCTRGAFWVPRGLLPKKRDKRDENERDGNVTIIIIIIIVINITLLEHDPPAKLSSV